MRAPPNEIPCLPSGLRQRFPQYLLWGLLIGTLAIATGAGLAAWQRMAARRGGDERPLEGLQVFWTVPDFSLVERSGRRVTLADLQGKVWIADFIYTECTETCPLQTAYMAKLGKDLAAERDLRFVSITVDPRHDTPAVLRKYAERYRADPERWLFLTGDKRVIYDLAQKGFRLAVQDVDGDEQGQSRSLWPFGPRPAYATHGSKGLVIHSSRLVLVDRQARTRGFYPGTEPDAIQRLKRDAVKLLRER